MKLLDEARKAARQTPSSRNRAIDFFRVVAILFVVLGHWFLVAPFAQDGEIELRSLLAEQRSIQYLTWLFQVMPVFFFVGGYSNAAAWTSARTVPEKRRAFATKRSRRLLVPVFPLIVVWSLSAALAFQLNVEPTLVSATSQAALIPVWFLAVYIMVTLVVPISFALWERIGLWSVVLLAGLAVAIDVIGIGMGQTWLRWANYAPIWLAAHQLGYWWFRGGATMRSATVLIILGAVWMYALIGMAGYPISMVSVAGEDFSNTRPPTTAMLALGCIQAGFLLFAEQPIQRWLERETPWALTIVVARMIMTIYLWHLTAVVVLIGISMLLGGWGLHIVPGSASWWGTRPIWILALFLTLIPFLVVFSRFETGSRAKGEAATPIRSIAGTVLACAGLTIIALKGIGIPQAPGFNWIATGLVLVGIATATLNPARNTR